jgi:predicted Zn-dependent peptidase
MNRAQLLGKYEVLDGDPSLVNSELERLGAVSSKQIQAFATKYLTDEKRAILEIVPEQNPGAPKSGGSAKKDEGK